MTRVDSVLRVLEQLFMTMLHPRKAIVPVITMENTVSHVVAIVPVRARKVVTNLVRVVISLAKVVISVRVRVVTKVVISLARAVTSLVRARVATSVRRVVISLVRDRAATSVRVRVVTNPIRSLMANPAVLIRRVPVSIRPIMIRMLSTA
jgi:hypothetical protein